MNYFELHIGDYEAATAHLTMLEDAAYCRMLRIYYRTEQPLPSDKRQLYRLTRAQSKQERDAVDQVLRDFFTLHDDGWHQSRCDEEIARYVAGEPEREVKKANEANRLRRHRDERACLFKALTDAGQHAPWNIGMQDLRALVNALQATPEPPPETLQPPLPATAPATPATATQTPDTRHQTPVLKEKEITHTEVTPTDGGRVCVLMRSQGLASTNPAHPELLALIDAGASDDEFAQAAKATVDKGKGFAYALGIVKRQREEAAAMVAKGLHRGPLPQAPPSTATRKDRQLLGAAYMLGLKPATSNTPEIIDVDTRAATASPRLG